MKNSELKRLLEEIVHSVLDELTSISTSDMKTMLANNPSMDSSVSPLDAMTPAEKARNDRETELARQKDIKQKETELSAKKKEMEFNKKKLDQQKRFDIPNATKDLQQLKGAQI